MPAFAAPGLWMVMCLILITFWFILIQKVFHKKSAGFVNFTAAVMVAIMVVLVPLSYKILDLVS